MSVGFAIVGAGHMGRTYADALGRSAGMHLVAVTGGTRAPDLASQHHAAFEGDLDGLLGRPDVDAIIIATPHSSHMPLALAAAAAGKHVFLEKPMALSTSECRTIIDACRHARVLLSVGKVSRRLAASEMAKRMIDDGAIGRIEMLQAWRLRADINLELVGPKPWSHDPAEGSAFLDWGTHGCDILRWLTGLDADLAFGQFTSYEGRNPLHSSGMAQYRFPSGVMAHVWMSYEMAANLGARTRYVVVGSSGVLELHPFGQVTLRHGPDATVVFQRPGFEDPDAPADERDPYFQDAFAAQLIEFARAIAGSSSLSVTGEDGASAVEMVEAAERSSALGQAVALPIGQT